MDYLDVANITDILRKIIYNRWRNDYLYGIYREKDDLIIKRNYFYSDDTATPEDKVNRLYGYFGGKGLASGTDVLTYKKYIQYSWLDNIEKYDKYLLEILQVGLNEYVLKNGNSVGITPGKYKITIFTADNKDPFIKNNVFTYEIEFPNINN